MSHEEWDRADRLARHYGLNIAGMLRMLMMDRERDLGASLAPPEALAPAARPRTKKR